MSVSVRNSSKKGHELKKIVDEIIYKTGLTQEEISNRIGYKRPYFNTLINDPGMNGKKVEGRLRAEFAEILDPMYITTTAKPSQVVKPAKDDQLTQRVEALEKRVAEIEAQLRVIISLLRK